MSTLDMQVGRARRRLTLNVLFHRLALGVLMATGLWTIALLIERALVLGIPVLQGIWIAAALATVFTLIATWWARVPVLQAAVAIDAAAGLKERVSSALILKRDADPFARAVVRDAEQAAGRVHVPTHLPYRAPELWPWSVATILVAVLLGFFMPKLNLLAAEKKDNPEELRVLADSEKKNIDVDLQDRLNKIKQMAENNPALEDLTKDLKPLEMPDSPTLTPEDVRREAAKTIDKVSDRLAEKKEAAGLDALRETQRALSRLQPEQGTNPAAELSKSLAAGDFQGAKKALEKLEKDVQEAAAKGDPESQAKLAQVQAQLKKLADQLAEMDDSLYLQKELKNKAGLSDEAAKKLAEELKKMDPKQLEKELQRQLGDKNVSQEQIKEIAKKIQQQQQSQQQCQNLSQCLAQAAQACQQCTSPGSAGAGSQAASAALSNAMSQMSDMEMSEQMLSEMEAQLADLKNMRNSVCKGDYCKNGQCPGGENDGRIGSQGPQYGRGIGSRIGSERVAHNMTPTKANTQAQGGTIIGQMLVDGPQMRGNASAAERDAVNAAQRDAQDAIDRDLVPRQYHSAVQEYFLQLAGLLKSGQAAAPTPAPAGAQPEAKPAPAKQP